MRAAGALTLATAACAAAVWRGLPMLGAEAVVTPALVALAICGGCGLVALLPVAWLDRRKPGGAAYGFMIGMLVRLVGCSVGYVAVKGHLAGPASTFTYAIAGAYLFVLVVELLIIGRHVRRLQMPVAARANVPAGAEATQC